MMSFSVQHLYRNSVVLLCGALAILLTSSMTFVSFLQLRNDYARELGTQARMLSVMLQGVDEADAATMESRLKIFTLNPATELVCLFRADGTVQSSMNGPSFDATSIVRDCSGLSSFRPTLRHVVGSASISDPLLPKEAGSVKLMGKLPPVQFYFGLWLTVAIVVALLLAFVCWLLGLHLQKLLLTPIRHIATTAQRVSLYKDYSLRVVAGGLKRMPSEIESLTDSFNAMLSEIEDRDNRLTRKSAELEKSQQAAEAANLAKAQFLSNVSHELRTPLNAIIGFSTMLSEEQFGPVGSEKYAEYARDIHDSGRHLLDVINDILDLSKAESGKLSMKFESNNVNKLVQKALNIVAGQAHQRKIDVYTQIPDKMPKIVADRVRFVQILLNLLSNSIKFTREGGKVVVRVNSEEGKNGVHYFTIEVEDNGIGMSETQIRSAFSTFNQADSGLNRKYEGAGLGLPLTKRLVELHHGKIKIESEPGRGTTVTVRLTSDPALLD